MCIVMVSLSVPVSLHSLSLSCFLNLTAAKVTKTGSSPFVPYLLPSSRSTLCLPMPCFPYFGMSMCYLLTLCMNDNMSVYSYRELYPISLVLTKKGLNVVQIQVFLFFCSVTFCNVCRA